MMSPTEIKQLMIDLGYTQKQLGDAIGCHRVTVADWVRGASRPKGLYIKALFDLAYRVERRKKAQQKSNHRNEQNDRPTYRRGTHNRSVF
jgi:transcriptional regulator with XRE-family HTH domain